MLQKALKKNHTAISMAILYSTLFLTACGFHLQGEKPLSPELHRLYLQTHDPYGILERTLQQYLKLSHVVLVTSPTEAHAILVIMQNSTSQRLLSVSSTQQTRQYLLQVNVIFEVTDTAGRVIITPQTLSEGRNITIQSNQILGSSNEAYLYYQQIRRSLANAIINRLASKQITSTINNAFPEKVRATPLKNRRKR